MDKFLITLHKDNIDSEHICCAFSDKKSAAGYALKKEWLRTEFDNGYVFRRLDERAKVFIEYGPAETAWAPVDADGYLMLGCFWVAGQYKGEGYGKELLQSAIDDARARGKNGLIAVVGTKKLPFMSETKWLLRQGFEQTDQLSYGISLLTLKLLPDAPTPQFKEHVRSGLCPNKEGITVYYSNRCPYTEFYIGEALPALAEKYGVKLTSIKLNSAEEAQSSPAAHSVFTMFSNGRFLTTDMSVCTETRFLKLLGL